MTYPYKLRQAICEYIEIAYKPCTASTIAEVCSISTQRAVAILHQLEYEGYLISMTNNSQRFYGTKEIFMNCMNKSKHKIDNRLMVLFNMKYGKYMSSGNWNSNEISVEITVENEEDIVEFEFDMINKSFKEKFILLLHNILYAYFC